MIDHINVRPATAAAAAAVEVRMSYGQRLLTVTFRDHPTDGTLVNVIRAVAVTKADAAVDLKVCCADLEPSTVVVSDTLGSKTQLPAIAGLG